MAISNIGISTNNWDPLLTHILIRKLDSTTSLNYESQLTDIKEPQTLQKNLTYIENRFMALQSANARHSSMNGQQKFDNLRPENPTFDKSKGYKSNAKTFENKCIFCAGGHTSSNCAEFLKKQVSGRIDTARSKKLCMNCLTDSHKCAECKSKFTCKTCNKRHHTVLHLDTKTLKANTANLQATNEVESDENVVENDDSIASLATISFPNVLLATALVTARAKNGQTVVLRALIDQGSQGAFVTEDAVQTLELTKKPCSINFSGIGKVQSKARSVVHIDLMPHFSSEFILNTTAIVWKKFTKITSKITIDNFDYLRNLKLAI